MAPKFYNNIIPLVPLVLPLSDQNPFVTTRDMAILDQFLCVFGFWNITPSINGISRVPPLFCSFLAKILGFSRFSPPCFAPFYNKGGGKSARNTIDNHSAITAHLLLKLVSNHKKQLITHDLPQW